MCVWSTAVRSCGGRARAGPAKGRSASVRAMRTRSRRDRELGVRGTRSEDACGTDLRGRRAMPTWRTEDGDEVRTSPRAAARPCSMRGRRPTPTPRARSAAIRWPRASRTPMSGCATSADKTSRSEPWCWGVGTATTTYAAPARAWGRERSTDRTRWHRSRHRPQHATRSRRTQPTAQSTDAAAEGMMKPRTTQCLGAAAEMVPSSGGVAHDHPPWPMAFQAAFTNTKPGSGRYSRGYDTNSWSSSDGSNADRLRRSSASNGRPRRGTRTMRGDDRQTSRHDAKTL